MCKFSKPKQGGGSIGQLDDSPSGRAKTVAYLNLEIAHLVNTYFPHYMPQLDRFMLSVKDYDRSLSTFNLSSFETLNSKPNPRYFITFEMKNPEAVNGACQPIAIELSHTTATNKLSSLRTQTVLADPVCSDIEGKQQNRIVTASIADIATTCPGMWYNSVAIDMFINYIKEMVKDPQSWYIVSAEDTPERQDRLRELHQTPRCYPNIIIPMYRDHHWTISYVDNTNKVIYHLNSDVVDSNTPMQQIEPFIRTFPGYRLIIIPCLKQCDNSSCGAYVCYWAYAFMFLAKSELLRISCPDILRFRTLSRRQLLLSYYVCPVAGVSDVFDSQ